MCGSIHSSIQNDNTARTTHSKKQVTHASGHRASFAERYQALFWTIWGEKMEESIEEELRMQKLQWKLYHLSAFYCHQEQNIGKQLILFSDVLNNNSLTKCKGPEHLTESCLCVALITCSLVRSNQPVDPSCINQVVNRTQIPLHLLKSLLDFLFTGYITAKCQMPCCIEIYITSK